MELQPIYSKIILEYPDWLDIWFSRGGDFMPRVHPVLRGMLTGIFIAVILGLVICLLLSLTALPEFNSTWGYAVLALIVFLGGFTAAHREGKKGLLIGVEVAVGFILLLIACNWFLYPGQLVLKTALIKIGTALAAGVIGGAAGVAFKSR